MEIIGFQVDEERIIVTKQDRSNMAFPTFPSRPVPDKVWKEIYEVRDGKITVVRGGKKIKKKVRVVKKVIWVVFPFLLFFSSGYGESMIIRGSILRKYFGRDSFGKMIGITIGPGSIGGIVGPTLAGWVFGTLRSYHLIWLVFCGLSGLAISLVLRIK